MTTRGICACGCGQQTKLAPRTRANRGWVAGEPMRFLAGHVHPMPTPAIDRFHRHVRVDPSGCWIWTGRLNNAGYGTFYGGERGRVYAHRWSYETFNGAIPDGMTVDHLCRVPACCNPEHLEAVTQRINMLRGVHPSAQAVRANRCKRDHEFTPENTYHRSDRPGRQCKKCNAIRKAERKARAAA